MANVRPLMLYLMIITTFSFFIGQFAITNENATEGVQAFRITEWARQTFVSDSSGVISSVIKVVTAPFLLLDLLLYVFAVISVGFFILPGWVNIFIFTPLGILVIFDYIIPLIRGV